MSSPPERFVDCQRLFCSQPEISFHLNGANWHFITDESLKRGKSFHYGIFFDDSAWSEKVTRYPKAQRAAVLLETPIRSILSTTANIHPQFPLIFSHQKSLAEQGAPFQPFEAGCNWLGIETRHDLDTFETSLPDKSKLLSFMGSIQHADTAGYTLRRQVAEHLLSQGDVDCFGKGIQEIQGKRDALAPYAFSVAMENTAADYYFTEKLVDCLLTRTVPLYFGAPGIGELFDSRGMILFRNMEEFQATQKSLTWELYDQMLPYVEKNKQIVIENLSLNVEDMCTRIAQTLSLSEGTPPPVPYPSARSLSLIQRMKKAVRRTQP